MRLQLNVHDLWIDLPKVSDQNLAKLGYLIGELIVKFDLFVQWLRFIYANVSRGWRVRFCMRQYGNFGFLIYFPHPKLSLDIFRVHFIRELVDEQKVVANGHKRIIMQPNSHWKIRLVHASKFVLAQTKRTSLREHYEIQLLFFCDFSLELVVELVEGKNYLFWSLIIILVNVHTFH